MRPLTRLPYKVPIAIIAAAGSLGLAPIYGWWPLALLGVGLTLWVSRRARSYRQAALFGFVIGLTRSLLVLGWTWSTYPINWMGITAPSLQLTLIGAYWCIAALALAGGYVLLLVALRPARSWPWLWQLGYVPVLWILADATGAFLFSIVWYGPGARVGADFSFGYIGYALVTHRSLFRLAQYGGVWALSVTAVLIGTGLFMLWKQHLYKWLFGLLAIVCIASFVSLEPMNPAYPPQTVALVSTSFPAKLSSLGGLFRLTQLRESVVAALQTKADTIILPEDSRFTDLFSGPTAALQFITAHATKPVVVVDSARVPVGNHSVLRAFVYDTRAQTYYTFDKQYLVPQGEFEPYLTRWLAHSLSLRNDIKTVINETNYEPGTKQSTVQVPDYVPAVLFCFESVTPWGVRAAVRDRQSVPFVAHVVSHDWFHGHSPLLDRQLDAMLQVQAAWNDLPIYMATNADKPAVFWPNGRIEWPQPTQHTPYWNITLIPGA